MGSVAFYMDYTEDSKAEVCKNAGCQEIDREGTIHFTPDFTAVDRKQERDRHE
jgi:hypothetical protein